MWHYTVSNTLQHHKYYTTKILYHNVRNKILPIYLFKTKDKCFNRQKAKVNLFINIIWLSCIFRFSIFITLFLMFFLCFLLSCQSIFISNLYIFSAKHFWWRFFCCCSFLREHVTIFEKIMKLISSYN